MTFKLAPAHHCIIMELQIIPSALALCASFALILITLVKKLMTNNNSFSPKLPPGPRKLFLIGNIHQLVGSLPHRKLTDLADEHGPIMHLKLGEVPMVVVSSPDIAQEIMRTHDINFARRPALLPFKILGYNCTNVAFSPYGPFWRQLRKICATELLGAKKVGSFRSVREEEADTLISAIKASTGKSVNLSKMLSAMTYGIIARSTFGRKCEHGEKFIELVERSVKLVSGFSLSDLYPSSRILPIITGFKYELEKLHEEADMIMENIITEHAKREAATSVKGAEGDEEGLVGVLLKIQEQSDLEVPLTRNAMKGILQDMFSAGGETSSTLVEWAMAEILKNPRVMRKAQAEVRETCKGKGRADEENLDELKYLKLIIMETLRLHPPAPLLLPRENVEPCVVNGYDIPAHTRLVVNAWAIGRDPRHWHDPENFTPERFGDSSMDYAGRDFRYIPFGAGRRICPGIAFAIPSMVLPLAQLLYHFDWELADGTKLEDLDMSESFGVTAKRKDDLVLVPIPYINASNVA